MPSENEAHPGSVAHDLDAYATPTVAVDVALLTVTDRTGPGDGGPRVVPAVLLHRRAVEPFVGRWALPGGILHEDQESEHRARGVLAAMDVDLEDPWLEQLATFDGLHRDPRKRVLSVAYLGLVDPVTFNTALPRSGEVMAAPVVDVDVEGRATVTDEHGEVLDLAFDHDLIVGTAVTRVRGRLSYTPIGYELLGEVFTLRELHAVHAAFLEETPNVDSFRRRVLESGEVEETGEVERAAGHRPARLFRYRG